MTQYPGGVKCVIFICSVFILLTTDRGLAQIYSGGSGDGFSIATFVQPDNPAYDIYKGGTEDGFASSTFVQPDNASYDIYKGGAEDGFAVATFIQPDNASFDIYKGGIEDGFAAASFIQPDDISFDIYKGGVEDGFAAGTFIQPDNTSFDIYKGGIEDGFAAGTFIQPDNTSFDIYKGGSEDGFSMSCFLQPSAILYDIYKGGNGDGFTIFCLGSIGNEIGLPIHLLNFNGIYQDNVVHLQWRTASELNNDYFVVERSNNSLQFKDIYKVPGAGTTTQTKTYSFTDENPVSGINYYRLRQVDFNGVFTYSSIIAITAESKGPSMTIFPNPSDNSSIVNVKMNGVGEGTPVELTITSIYGQVMNTYVTTLDSNQQIKLPNSISNGLASGVYVVSVRFSLGHLTTKWVVK